MNRHYCVSCSKKLTELRMFKMQLPYNHARVWVCNTCFNEALHKAIIIQKPTCSYTVMIPGIYDS